MISRIYRHPTPNGARNNDCKQIHWREFVGSARILILLLSCAVMTLSLGPNQFAKLNSYSVDNSLDARKPLAPEKRSAREAFNVSRSTLPAQLQFLPLRARNLLTRLALAETVFTVTNTSDNGDNSSPAPGSLRAAIINANASGGGTINFNIPASDPNCNATTHVCTITPVIRSLPDINAPVTIDGYTQPGASPNTLAEGEDAVLLIELSGGASPSGYGGLVITAPNCTVRGLVINGFNPNGIALFESVATNTHIEGNFIGTNAAGMAAIGNSTGIYSQRANGNQIGGTDPAARNVISGNGYGILIENGGGAPAVGNIIQGNYVGTNAAGTAAVPNQAGGGIVINSGQNNLVGGTTPGASNLVSGNLLSGIRIASSFPAARGNVVQGNFVGTDITGTETMETV